MSETIRSFIAIELPETIISSIGKVQQGMKSYGLKMKWVRPESIHLTLKFLGNIPVDDLDRVGDAMTDTAENFGPVSLAARGIGVFPNMRRPRVVWVGISGQVQQLVDVQAALDERLMKIGFTKEKRSFKGHLTLGRIKQRIDNDRLMAAMREFSGFESDPYDAQEIILFKSQYLGLNISIRFPTITS